MGDTAPPAKKPRRPTTRFTAAVSVVALGSLCFVLGAAVMYFNLPTSDFLRKAFGGAETWLGAREVASAPAGDLSQAEVTGDVPGKTSDGFTLFTTTLGPEATLIDMRGRVAHRWKLPEARPWPHAAGARDPRPKEPLHWERCHLYPNGDILALCSAGASTPYGYGLVKLDKDSRVLWGRSANVHHDFDVAEDGRIYTLTDRSGAEAPPGLGTFPGRYIADNLLILSPEGEVLDSVPILEAFRNSPYLATLLAATESAAAVLPGMPGAPPGMPPPPPGAPPLPGGHTAPDDVLHTNSVHVLSARLAPKFPQFKAGQVLLSLRTPSLIAVLDPQTRKVVWAARGIWQSQHDPRFLDNGNILLFDNLGSPRGSRVLEYSPATQAVPWSYSAEQGLVHSVFRGLAQRLPNGNTLVVNSDGRRLVEVTPDKEVVWQWHCPAPAPAPGAPPSALSVTGARRYAPEQLTFLKGTPHERPR